MEVPSRIGVKSWFDINGLSISLQFAILACGVFLFFGAHNLLQETMMNVSGFHFGVMLGYMEVFGYAMQRFGLVVLVICASLLLESSLCSNFIFIVFLPPILYT
jgi:hypothetical protein